MAYFKLQKTHFSLKLKPLGFLDSDTVITCDKEKQCMLYSVAENKVTGKFNISFTASRLLQKSNSSDISTLFLIGYNHQRILTVARIALNDNFSVTERCLSQSEDERVILLEREETIVFQLRPGLIVLHHWWGSSFTCQLDPRFQNCHLAFSNAKFAAVATGNKSLLVWQFNREGNKQELRTYRTQHQFTALACEFFNNRFFLLGNGSNGKETKPNFNQEVIEVEYLKTFPCSTIVTDYLGVVEYNMIFQTSSELHRLSIISPVYERIQTYFDGESSGLKVSAKVDFFYNLKKCSAGSLQLWVVSGWEVISKEECYRQLLRSIQHSIQPQFIDNVLSLLKAEELI